MLFLRKLAKFLLLFNFLLSVVHLLECPPREHVGCELLQQQRGGMPLDYFSSASSDPVLSYVLRDNLHLEKVTKDHLLVHCVCHDLRDILQLRESGGREWDDERSWKKLAWECSDKHLTGSSNCTKPKFFDLPV
jgi:hypothetical protein